MNNGSSKDKFFVRHATQNDASAIAVIYAETKEDTIGPIGPALRAEVQKSYAGLASYQIDQPETTMLVAGLYDNPDHIIGFAYFSKNGRDITIQSLYTNQPHQGIGSVLIDSIKDHGRNTQKDYIVVNSSLNAAGFYAHKGFEHHSLTDTMVFSFDHHPSKKRLLSLFKKLVSSLYPH